ncbi:carbonic anhydrase [Pontibacillus litoralis]|uniref:Carbonic anhydrase n=1 Tax=Pontibacillus litoralis JSM 072002 TaxID=1385512 RepID=A0A0A5G134_9BACI|nr:carbonic anhydrase [Pontibacillus litoralis]KGX84785.1 hypothetical protein N784_11885 [Pontibacillus litoralis JSM 072002]
MTETFVTAINCKDGRAQLPVIYWMQERFSAQYVDMITEPGPTNHILNATEQQIETLKAKINISHNIHGSKAIAIVAHNECAGNPISKEEQKQQVSQCVDIVNSWGYDMKVIGLFVNENWEVELIEE